MLRGGDELQPEANVVRLERVGDFDDPLAVKLKIFVIRPLVAGRLYGGQAAGAAEGGGHFGDFRQFGQALLVFGAVGL